MWKQIGPPSQCRRSLAFRQPFELVVNTNPLEDGSELARFLVDQPTPNLKHNLYVDVQIVTPHVAGPTGAKAGSIEGLLIAGFIPEVKEVTRNVSAAVK